MAPEQLSGSAKRENSVAQPCQARLSGLVMFSIEKELREILDYESLMDEFASRNACKAIFKK